MSPSPTGPGFWTPASRLAEREKSCGGATPQDPKQHTPFGAGLDVVQAERDAIAAALGAPPSRLSGRIQPKREFLPNKRKQSEAKEPKR